ncbi:LysR family transcriptional regulator [Ramlibacter sp.]|uniref:LysR family transcriptional regulator n=1 Tax=Ramlibacter sp. TaxID=1917967 RepID=UPI003D0A342F
MASLAGAREPGRGRRDLTMIATLKALLDTGNVSRAADSLGVTQPSVSQALKRLRDYFGDELFVRSGNAMRPTPRALDLAPAVHRLMRDLSLVFQSNAEFNATAARREFVVCTSDIAEFLVVPGLASIFAEEAPGCALRTVRLEQSRLRDALERGDADVALGTLSGADGLLRQQTLGEFAATCMVSTRGRWADARLTQEGFASARHVVVQRLSDSLDRITDRLRVMGMHRDVVLRVDNHFAAAQAVSDADLICTVPNVVMAHKLASLFPVKLVPLPFEFGRFTSRLLWHERYQKDPGHIWLRTATERCVRAMARRAEHLEPAAATAE